MKNSPWSFSFLLQASPEAAKSVGTPLKGTKALLYEAIRFEGDCFTPIKTFVQRRYARDLNKLGKDILPRQLALDSNIVQRMKELGLQQRDIERLPEIYSIAVWDSPRGGHMGMVADYDLEYITIVESNLRGDGQGGVRRISRHSAEWTKDLLALWDAPGFPTPSRPRNAAHLKTECRVRAAGFGELGPAIKGEIAGTVEEQRGLEGFWLDAEVPLRYRVRVGERWSNEVPNRTWVGISNPGEVINGIGVRLLRSDLTIELAVHFEADGWVGPFRNGKEATAKGRRIEAVSVFILRLPG
ncbi:MAG: hypothetical protein QM758_10865 [Armatimonas sp.]